MSTRYRWVVIGLLWFVCFFNYADRPGDLLGLPPVKTEMHLSDIQFGVIGSRSCGSTPPARRLPGR